MEEKIFLDFIISINDSFFFLCKKYPFLSPKELHPYLFREKIEDNTASFLKANNEYDKLIERIWSILNKDEYKNYFFKLSLENQKFLSDSVDTTIKLKTRSFGSLWQIIDSLNKTIKYNPPIIVKGKIRELFIWITNELQDIYFNINNFKIWQKVDNHFSQYKGVEIYKIAEKNFNITRLHMHASMTASYQCIINTFCNLYEKVSNNVGLVFQLKSMLKDDLKLNINDKYIWFGKPYEANNIIISRNNFTAHLNLAYDIPKNIDKLLIDIQTLEHYFFKAYKNWQLINNWLTNIGVINFLPLTVYQDDYLKNFIDERSKRIIEFISKKN